MESESTAGRKQPRVLFGLHDIENDYIHVLNETRRPRIFKIIWGTIVAVLLGFTFYMVYQLLAGYFQYNSYNTSETGWKSNVALPAISICSTNVINYTALAAELSADNTSKEVLTKFDTAMIQLAFTEEGDIWDSLDLELFIDLGTWEDGNGSFVAEFAHSTSSLTVGSDHYLFENIGRVTDNSSYFTTELGKCLEINDDGEMKQSLTGTTGGFTIDLDAHVDDYLPTTATNGFVVFIRDQDETVMLNKGGYIISPGTETFMRLEKKSITRLGDPHGSCKNVLSEYTKYGNHFETVRECIERQMIFKMIVKCSCMPWYSTDRFYTLNKTDLLDYAVAYLDTNPTNSTTQKKVSDLRYWKNHSRQEDVSRRDASEDSWVTQSSVYTSKYAPYICGFVEQQGCQAVLDNELKREVVELEDCSEPCEYNEWDVDISTTVFPPTQKYYEIFLQNETGNASFEYARNNLARIHIYYDDIKVEHIEQEKSYEVQNFIAEFGGTVDLFIGFSFFTVFQLIEIGIATCIYKKCYNRKKKVVPSNCPTSEPTVPSTGPNILP